jgi:transcriptional regulator with XRE-family HTH domain
MVDYRTAPSLGERIQAARKARGIRSAKALADLIDNGTVTEAILQNIETGRLSNLSVSQLLNIAYALKVAPSFLLAPLGRPTDPLDLPNLSSGLTSMTSVEFDAWLSGTNAGAYRPTNAAEIAERTELAAYRDLHHLLREQSRLRVLKDMEGDALNGAAGSKPWDRTGDRLASTEQAIAEVLEFLQSAGWPLGEEDSAV